MTDEAPGNDWKLTLRYGRAATPFQHYALIADGVAGALGDGFECRPGPAVMAMKGWPTDADAAADMRRFTSGRIGFEMAGRIEIHETPPDQPPRENPFGCDICFVPYDGDTDE